MADSHEYIASLDDVKIGKNVLESLTRSAYDDCRCILREYVQNAADQIDLARDTHLSESDDYSIHISLDKENKRIEIYDNATGVAAQEVLPILRNVACSQKKRGKHKGFRGIGRLGGLGYCSTLTFITSYKGEEVKSILKWDADKMTRMIDDDNVEDSASEVVAKVTELRTEREDKNKHYFKIVMENVTDMRLLDVQDIRNYISMVSPVEISNDFLPFKTLIKRFMAENNLTLDTYDIYVNGDQMYKKYTKSILGKKGTIIDEVKDLKFFIENDSEGNPFYWGWYSICKLEGILDSTNIAKGIRLRCKNIQLGNDNNCRRFLPGKQEERFTDYFFGEIHVLSERLIPDMDRNYLRVDDARTEFEGKMIEQFAYLKSICHDASEHRSDIKKIQDAEAKQENFEKKKRECSFNSEEERQREQEAFIRSKEEADKARKRIERRKEKMKETDSPLQNVLPAPEEDKRNEKKTENESSWTYPTTVKSPSTTTYEKKSSGIRTDRDIYNKFSDDTREVISSIYRVIGNILTDEWKTLVIAKIEEEITK